LRAYYYIFTRVIISNPHFIALLGLTTVSLAFDWLLEDVDIIMDKVLCTISMALCNAYLQEEEYFELP